MNLKNLKIGTQLKLGFAVLLLFVIVLGTVSYIQTEQIQQQTDGIYMHPLQVRRAIGYLKADILTIQRDLKDLFLTTDEKEIALDLNRIELSRANAYEQIDIIYKQYLGPRTDIDLLKQAFVTWSSIHFETIRLFRNGKIREATYRTKAFGVGGIQAEVVIAALQKIDDFAKNKGDTLYTSSKELKASLNRQLVMLIVAILFISIIVNYILLRNIREPLGELTDAARRFQEGDKDARSSYESNNEFGGLSASFNSLTGSIQSNLDLNEKAARLADVMLSEDDAIKFFHTTLTSLASSTGSQLAAVYLLNDDNKSFDHFVSIGMDDNARQSFAADSFEGELGTAISLRKVQHIKNIPEDTQFIFHAACGKFIPREIITIPIVSTDKVIGVISLASVSGYEQQSLQLVSNILNTLSARISGVLAYRTIKDFSDKLENQNRELEVQKVKLEKASSYNRCLIEASIDPLVTIGPDGRITDVNTSTEAVTGLSRVELIGTDFADYFTEPENARQGYQQVFRDGFVRDYELSVRHTSGKVTPVFYNAAVYRDEKGQVIGVFAAARDISERKRTEQELLNLNHDLIKAGSYNRCLIEASIDPLVTIGPDGRITDVNTSTESVTGLSRVELIGTDFADYFTEPENARNGYQQVFRDGFVRDYELSVRHTSGQVTPVFYNAAVYRDENDQVIGVFAAARDMSEQKRTEQILLELNQLLTQRSENLADANRELEAQKTELASQSAELMAQNTELEMQKIKLDEASRLKSNFLSNMSHELRTPLNSVIALSGVLNRRLAKKIPEEEYSYLEVIERNGKHLLLLINDILDISRIEAGREEVEITRFNANSLVDDVVCMIHPQAKKKNIELLHSDSDKNITITSDANKCRHILLNLIGNAVKFTEKGKVEISARQTEKDIQITVTDTGIGIEKTHLPHIFDEFRQADSSTSRKFGGTGLGLAIAKKYAHLLGGSISVNSTIGSGSEFTLSLPLHYASELRIFEEDSPRYEIKQLPHKPVSGSSVKTILLVEDSEPAIIQLKETLEESGYQILVARDGGEALGIIDYTIPDAMVLDLMMPGIDGFTVLETIREADRTAHIPVLILTARHINKEELKFLKRNNIHQLIQKGDVNREELQHAVASMVFPEPVETVKPQRKLPAIEGKPLVLIVEDNPDNMLTVKAILDDSYTILEAADGNNGVEMAKKHKPDLILMDIALPGMNGIEAFNVIRNDTRLQHIPVIALTASAMIADRETILAHGFNAYIAKPINEKQLFKSINVALYGD